MRGLSRRRGRARQQLVAGVFCAASFLAGQMLLGDEPAVLMSQPTAPQPTALQTPAPQTVWNRYLGEETGDRGQGTGVVLNAHRGAGSALRPAAIQPVDNPAIEPALPGIISPRYARPLKSRGTEDRGQKTEDRGQRTARWEGEAPAEPRLIEARPLWVEGIRGEETGDRRQETGDRSQRSEIGSRRSEVPLTTQQAPRTTLLAPVSPAEESLPPIIPAAALPRPTSGAKGQGSGVRGREGEAPAEPLKLEVGGRKLEVGNSPAPWMQDIRAALGESAERPARNAELNPKSKIQTPKSLAEPGSEPKAEPNPQSPIPNPKLTAVPAQFTREADDSPLFTAHSAQPPAVQPAPPPAPLAGAAAPQVGVLPPGSPFEAIGESGTLRLRVRRSLLMRTKVDIYRTAVVDEGVCDIVQFTPREISLIGRSQGSTHITFWFDDAGTPPVTYLVSVEPDADAVKRDEYKFQMLEDLVNEQFPDSKIRLTVLADKLLLKGQAKDSEEAAQILAIVRTQGQSLGAYDGGLGPAAAGVGDTAATGVIPAAAAGALNNQPTYQIVNMLRVPGVQQVALRVKIAELNRSAARGFGVNVAADIEFGDAVNGSQLLLASLLNTQATGETTGGASVIANISGDDASIGIRYLQEHGVIRLLSEPTLVTLSGKPATFVAGGEFAVPTVVGSVGLNAVTTDFRAFGAIISFVPTVVDKDRIRLQVAPEFSQINSDLTVGGTPGLNVRSATTTVEMREGQTLAIAGLLEDSYKATSVGDLPFLAKLFGRRDAARNETELIILVTPELVHPLEPEEVPPLPGFDVTEPTNAEFFLHGDLEGYPTRDYRSTVWPRLRKRYGGPAMTSGPFGHGQ